jgi:extradiol dioxygenase family protein
MAYHVRDLDDARSFYGDLLGCEEGRSTETWVDFDFFGHQISLHLGKPFPVTNTGRVGDLMVPMPHLGLVLDMPDWRALADRLTACDLAFVIEPTLRFEGPTRRAGDDVLSRSKWQPDQSEGFPRSLQSVCKEVTRRRR